jgi:hypothetical protein
VNLSGHTVDGHTVAETNGFDHGILVTGHEADAVKNGTVRRFDSQSCSTARREPAGRPEHHRRRPQRHRTCERVE